MVKKSRSKTPVQICRHIIILYKAIYLKIQCMKRTIIYVFGPKRLTPQYSSNTELKLQEGGWLKIGQTSEENDNIDNGNLLWQESIRKRVPVFQRFVSCLKF